MQPAIFPGWNGSVIRKADDGERELVAMSRGFVLLQPGKAPRRVTNVRDDKILTSKFWKPSFEARRCLVPASSYCEPDTGKPAKWHWFAVNGENDRELFAFPGIWQRWNGPLKKDGPNIVQSGSTWTYLHRRAGATAVIVLASACDHMDADSSPAA